MESDEIVERARKRRISNLLGIALDAIVLATTHYNEDWEENALSLPTWIGNKQPLQNPDGSFPFMLDYDELDEAPL